MSLPGDSTVELFTSKAASAPVPIVRAMDQPIDLLLEWKLRHGWTPGPGSLVSPEEAILLKVSADKRRKGKTYCVLCAQGPMPIKDMRLITPEEDPYIQDDPLEGEKPKPVRACEACFKARYGDGEESSSAP